MRRRQRTQEQSQCSLVYKKAFEKSTADSSIVLESVNRVPSTAATCAVRVFLTPEKRGFTRAVQERPAKLPGTKFRVAWPRLVMQDALRAASFGFSQEVNK